MASFDDLDLHFGFLKILKNKNRQNKKRKSMGEALQTSSHFLIHVARFMGAGVGTPLSSTVSAPGAPDGLMKGALPEKEGKKEEELPDLSSLKNEIRLIVEGKSNQTQMRRATKFCVLLLGKLDESGKATKDLISNLSEEMSNKMNERGIELILINTHLQVSLYSTPISPSELLLEYIKEQDGFSKIFVILLRGTNPETYDLPTKISETDFSSLVSAPEEGKGGKELLEKWYLKDKHNEGYRKLQPVTAVYKNLLSEKLEEYNKSYEEWLVEYNKVINILLKSQEDAKTPMKLCTTIEKDLQLIKDISTEIPFRVILIRKDAKRTPTEDKIDQFLQTLADDSNLRDLAKQTFSENRSGFDILRPKLSASEGSEEWWKEISAAIRSTLLDCIESSTSYPKTKKFNPMEDGINDKLLCEICSHLNFSLTVQRGSYSSHANYLSEVRKYVTSSSSKPLLITGGNGAGKSFLMSQISKTCHEWKPNACVMTRFIGVTENSTTVDGLIYFLVEQGLISHGFPSHFDCLNMYSNLKTILSKASNSRPVILLLSGMDKIVSDKESMSRFIESILELPENAKVILSAKEESTFYQEFTQKIKSEDAVLKIKGLDEDESERLLSSFMVANKQQLSKSSWDNIKTKQNTSTTPLYFFVLSHLLLTGTGEHENCNSGLENEIEYFFKCLQELFPKAILQTVLGCLALSRIGLLEKEILSLIELSHSPSIRDSILDWLNLRRLLRPLLQIRRERNLALISLHSSVRNYTAKFFLENEEKSSKCFNMLKNIIFKAEEVRILDASLEENQKHSLKYIRALQHSSLILERKSRDFKTFFNLNWLYKLVETSGPFKVLEELDLAIAASTSNSELLILREILELSSQSLVYDSSQFFSQIYGRLKWRLTDPGNCPNLSALLKGASESPLPCLLPLSSCLASTIKENSTQEDAKENSIQINSIFRIPGNPHHVVTISTNKGRVRVCNIINMEVVRTLEGINQPRKLEMIDDFKCLLLCGRELRIFNLNEGTFLMKLREVMNQKMPFFGLRDSDHVVSLSRNRMYVNMMNLTEGNCVTTFKVGEDRFLNSLLVSENGKICVCGDDTQKPSALLVWDLQLRKLMYDLRIPHHEFATRLAAITIEGHYVCCVCKEVDEPAPNFIVVYDLQSGTLFKRWKPEVNTISITISTAGTCVIVGLEDSSVMAFDLITGNRRWTVFGHTSPPDTFILDNQGLVLLSYDSNGRDRSLRVWDIHTGKSFATLTPDVKITGCEITCNGKAVVIALEGSDLIYTFLLLHNEDPSTITSNLVPYGDDEYKGKIADLSQA